MPQHKLPTHKIFFSHNFQIAPDINQSFCSDYSQPREALFMSASKKARIVIGLGSSYLSMAALMDPVRASLVMSALPVSGSAPMIGTHDGSFHCDEALAISMLKLLPEYQDCPVVRTRNPELLAQCSVVVDVGAVYDPANHRYDHHQKEFTGVLEGYQTKLSSAGLVYKHFGRSILRHCLETTDEAFVDVCFHKLYKGFVEHVDAIDNGISIADGTPRYHISTSLSSRVGMLNPAWNEQQTADVQNSQFIEAMALTGGEFVAHMLSLAKHWWPARSIVQTAMDSRLSLHASGQIILLDSACPWKDHLFEVESVMGLTTPEQQVLFALYQDTGGSWRVQAVPVDPTSFKSRKTLPRDWCGIRDDALSALTGQPGSIFVHTGGFIGGHQTKEGALAMAVQALSLPGL